MYSKWESGKGTYKWEPCKCLKAMGGPHQLAVYCCGGSCPLQHLVYSIDLLFIGNILVVVEVDWHMVIRFLSYLRYPYLRHLQDWDITSIVLCWSGLATYSHYVRAVLHYHQSGVVLTFQSLMLSVLTGMVYSLLLLDSLLNNWEYGFHPSVVHFTLWCLRWDIYVVFS